MSVTVRQSQTKVKMEEEKVRLYVGGLASEVGASDLRERFTPLGQVQSIILPPAKFGPGHRGFAYVDFVPATDASLRKLFSAYNGCKWRGGFLRIEKAKEHFNDRLHREWAVEAASVTTTDLPDKQGEAVQPTFLANATQMQVNGGNRVDMEATGLKIFFPSLRKLRTVPLTGLGKHKRSFQRTESSPLHLLSTCACDVNLRSGSCDCSNINSGSSSSKVQMHSESDDISRAIDNERERQLELLRRLFPSDTTPTLLQEEVVELDGSNIDGISEHKGPMGNAERTLSEPIQNPIDKGRRKSGQMKHLPQSSKTESMAGKQEDDSSDKLEITIEDDCTPHLVAKERAKQLDLMHHLFPEDAPSTREQVVKTEALKMNGKRKCEVLYDSTDMDSMTDTARSRIIEQLTRNDVETRTEHPSDEHLKINMHPSTPPVLQEDAKGNHSLQRTETLNSKEQQSAADVQKRERLKIIPVVLSDDLLEEDAEMILNLGDDSIPLATAEEQEREVLKSLPAVVANDLSEQDTEMILNLGDVLLPLATAEGQEKQVVKNLSVTVGESLQKDSGRTLHLQGDSFSLAVPKEQERQVLKSAEEVISQDSLEESKMTLNLGDESMPLLVAEEQERKVLMGMLPLDTPMLRNCGGVIRHVNKPELAEDSGNREDILMNEEYSEPTSIIQCNKSKQAEGSVQRSDVKISKGQQSTEPSKWAALAESCQLRETEGVKSTTSGLERKSMQAARRSREEDKPSNPVPLLQEEKSKTTSQQQTDSSRGQQLDDPSSSGQKLTRASWKSLVGESGRVVFSLRQVTGSSLPNTPSPTEETRVVDDMHIQMGPILNSKKGNQFQAKSKLPGNPTEIKIGGTQSSAQLKTNSAEHITCPVIPIFSSADCCPFMKSENAEEEWLATKSELRSDYRAKHKHAARNIKKLWGKRT